MEVNHQTGELGSINQHNLGLDFRHILNRVGGESAGRDEDALLRALAVQGPDKFLYLGATNAAIPFLGLDVDYVRDPIPSIPSSPALPIASPASLRDPP